MNRRGFLGSILAACAAPAIVRADSLMRIIAPDTLVFHPDAIELVVPEIECVPGGLLTISQITREALKILEKELAFCSQVNEAYDREFMRAGARIAMRRRPFKALA